MKRNEDRTGKGLSVKLCFRTSSIPQKAGRLYYQIIIRRTSYQYNSQYQIYETEWSKQMGLIITDVLSQRGKELMTIRKRTEWETAKLYEVAQRMFNVSGSVDYRKSVARLQESEPISFF